MAEDLEDFISSTEFDKAKELILDYEELVRRAQASLEAARSRFSPKEQALIDVGTCPECGNRTVLVGDQDEDICYFCEAPVAVRMCQMCGEYLPPGELSGSDICDACFSNRVADG